MRILALRRKRLLLKNSRDKELGLIWFLVENLERSKFTIESHLRYLKKIDKPAEIPGGFSPIIAARSIIRMYGMEEDPDKYQLQKIN